MGIVSSPIRLATRFQDRVKGLLGSLPSEEILLIAPCCSIHTFGMKYCIDVAFVNRSGCVMGVRRGVKPRKLIRCRNAYGVLERVSIPEQDWYAPGDRVGLAHCVACARSNIT